MNKVNMIYEKYYQKPVVFAAVNSLVIPALGILLGFLSCALRGGDFKWPDIPISILSVSTLLGLSCIEIYTRRKSTKLLLLYSILFCVSYPFVLGVIGYIFLLMLRGDTKRQIATTLLDIPFYIEIFKVLPECIIAGTVWGLGWGFVRKETNDYRVNNYKKIIITIFLLLLLLLVLQMKT